MGDASGRLHPDVAAAVRRARDLIDARYADHLDLRAIAASAGYSPYHFVRVFRRAYGDTPGQYLSRRRVERAQQLFRSADLTVTQVCHQVGFSSLGSFSTRFRDLVGLGPVEYQRRVRDAGGPPAIPGCFLLMAAGIPAADRTAISEKPSVGVAR